MSANAGAYYGERAGALGIDLSPTLSGEQVELLRDGRLSLHQPHNSTMEAIAMRCGEVLGAAGALVTAEARSRLLPAEQLSSQLVGPSKSFVRNMVLTSLRPAGLRTGHFTDIVIESLARDEVVANMLDSLIPAVRARTEALLADEEAESRQAYLLATGFFKSSGRAPLCTGAFVLVKAENPDSVNPQFLCVGLGRNAILGRSVVDDARATSHAVKTHSTAHAFPTATGTSKR